VADRLLYHFGVRRVARPLLKYGLAAILPAAVVGAAYGPFHCDERFGCMGGHAELSSWLLAVVLAAVVGIVGMAVADIAINGRYVSANRAEAKRRRRAATTHEPSRGAESQP
jgi:hypothetical protein